jgi:hypothetical protein
MSHWAKAIGLLGLVTVAVAVAAIVLHSYGASRAGEGGSTVPRRSLVVTWARTGETYRIRRECGALGTPEKPVLVDITEGVLPLTCVAARGVMSRYLSRRDNGSVVYDGLMFDCYNSRPDGVGWDYNCIHSDDGPKGDYVGVGAGRRPQA